MLIVWVVFACGIPASFGGEGFLEKRLQTDDDEPWRITAESLIYDADEGVYLAEGDVVISRGEQSLHAHKAVYREKDNTAEVSGDVRFESYGDVLSGDQGVFDFARRTGRLDNGVVFLRDNHFYIHAETTEKVGENTYLMRECRLTTCDGETPAWSITGSEVRVTVEGYGTIKDAAFRVRGVPLLYVPYFVFPAKTTRQSGLLPPSFGYSSSKGMEVQIPLFWAVSEQADATFYQRYMTERGYMQGLEFRYLTDEHSEGAFLFDIMSDREKTKDLNDPDAAEVSPYERTNQTRYWVRGRSDHRLPLDVEARFDADYVSDQDYLREFQGSLFGLEARPDLTEGWGRPLEENYSPTRRSALRLNRDGRLYSLQAVGEYNQRPENPAFDDTAQPLAGLDLNILPREVLGSVFFGMQSDYDYVWRDVGVKGHRMSLTPDVHVPLWLGPYVECEPSLRYTYTGQWLDDNALDVDRQALQAYTAAIRFSTNLERVYDVDWRSATSLKHRIWPVLTYEYRGDRDDNDFDPWFEPLRDESEQERRNGITFSLDNFLDARTENDKGEVRYRQWAYMKISQHLDMYEARRDDVAGERKEPFAPLLAELSISPSPELDLRGSSQWDHYDHEIVSSDISMEVSLDRSGGRRDSYVVDYRYDRDGTESIGASALVNLAYGYSVGGTLYRDAGESETITEQVWVDYKSQCWGVRFGVDSGDDTSVIVAFRFVGLGEFSPW